MSDKSDGIPKQALVTADAVAGLGMPEPIFLRGEDPSAYQSMLDQVRTAVEPSDFIEEAWVHDIVDLLWESIRCKRMKAAFVNAQTYEGLSMMLRRRIDGDVAYQLVEGWLRNNPDAIQQVTETLAHLGLTLHDARALTIPMHLRTIDAFDRMIAGAESRRSSVLREIDRRRAAFALALRSALKPIEEAEFTEVDQDEIKTSRHDIPS